ncbi:MAG: hypothetical protein ACK5PS_03540 [Desulfopila sp.]
MIEIKKFFPCIVLFTAFISAPAIADQAQDKDKDVAVFTLMDEKYTPGEIAISKDKVSAVRDLGNDRSVIYMDNTSFIVSGSMPAVIDKLYGSDRERK